MYHKIRSLNRSVFLGQIAELCVAQYPVFDGIQKQTLNEGCKKQGMYNVVGLSWVFFLSPTPHLTPSLTIIRALLGQELYLII